MNINGHFQVQSLFGLSLYGNYYYYYAMKAAEAASELTYYFGGTVATSIFLGLTNLNAFIAKNSLIWEIHLLPSRD